MKWRNGKAYNNDGSEMSPSQLDFIVKTSQQYLVNYKKKQENDELSPEEIKERLNNCNFKIC